MIAETEMTRIALPAFGFCLFFAVQIFSAEASNQIPPLMVLL